MKFTLFTKHDMGGAIYEFSKQSENLIDIL